jgi:hypothetical protein
MEVMDKGYMGIGANGHYCVLK